MTELKIIKGDQPRHSDRVITDLPFNQLTIEMKYEVIDDNLCELYSMVLDTDGNNMIQFYYPVESVREEIVAGSQRLMALRYLMEFAVSKIKRNDYYNTVANEVETSKNGEQSNGK